MGKPENEVDNSVEQFINSSGLEVGMTVISFVALVCAIIFDVYRRRKYPFKLPENDNENP